MQLHNLDCALSARHFSKRRSSAHLGQVGGALQYFVECFREEQLKHCLTMWAFSIFWEVRSWCVLSREIIWGNRFEGVSKMREDVVPLPSVFLMNLICFLSSFCSGKCVDIVSIIDSGSVVFYIPITMILGMFYHRLVVMIVLSS